MADDNSYIYAVGDKSYPVTLYANSVSDIGDYHIEEVQSNAGSIKHTAFGSSDDFVIGCGDEEILLEGNNDTEEERIVAALESAMAQSTDHMTFRQLDEAAAGADKLTYNFEKADPMEVFCAHPNIQQLFKEHGGAQKGG